ncbi:mechanosensitive ion channel family protein [Salipiger sp. IMCC34102]|uniref:mechanosensitive ion channel family protein n=1 Tax=Salipiger sp. IMCC34102 TaxID=2510647 RepID=UPI00101BB930|nr:mechanosensitive ion channel family protein [Salipiger sp. IMCC34102]RYH02817.1 mechanosensitive ion channel family protein [Salipiger sp. IMCC34102]
MKHALALPRLLVILFLWLPFGAAVAQDATFSVPELNAGLDDPGPMVDRRTPQSTVESFLDLTDDGDYDRAAHLLNLNAIPQEAQATTGPILARNLASVIERKVVIDWGDLLERPDALETTGDGPVAGSPRQSLRLGMLDLGDRAVAVRLNRVQPENGDAVWVFSRETVENIPALFEEYGPSKLEQHLPDPLRAEAFWGLQWWEVIGLPVIALIAIGIAAVVWRGLDAIARNQPSDIVSNLIRATRLPMTLYILAITLSLMTSQIFIVSGVVDQVTSPLIVILYVVALMILLISVIDALLDRLFSRYSVDELASPEHGEERARATTVAALRRIAVVAAVVIGAAVVLTSAQVFSGVGTSLLAGAGGLALIFGFAAREVLGNILASMQISLNRSAKVGDQLIYEGHLCTVERIHFSFVQLKVWDDTRLIVPVSKFISDSFINRSTETYGMIRHTVLTFAPGIDVSRLREHFKEWAGQDDRIDGDESETKCMVTGQSEAGIKVRFAAHVTDPTEGWGVECDIREEMLRYAVELGTEDEREYIPHLGTATGQGADMPEG